MASRRKTSAPDVRSLCSEQGERDGQDPRFDRPDLPGDRVPRKLLQLCRQAGRAIDDALACSPDDVLRDLAVGAVEPAPGSRRLLVKLLPTASAAPVEVGVVLAHLERAHGRLRAEVAAAVHRRKAPDLVFSVTPTGL